MAFILPIAIILNIHLGGLYNLIIPVFVFIILPIADWLIGIDSSNFSKEIEQLEAENNFYKYLLYIWVVVQSVSLIWICIFISSENLTTIEWIGITLSTMIMNGGIGITVAHELGHKKSSFERILSKLLLIEVFYGHFYIEHNRGHHVHVATRFDPASSRMNQSYYKFWMQTIFGSIKSALQLEKNRLNLKNKSQFTWSNECIRLWLFSFLFFISIFFISSLYQSQWAWDILLFLVVQSVLSFSLLEAVNYIEHYGIEREEISKDKFEKVNPNHSWNANHILSNFFLFQLQRHSDHHLTASKRYQVLKQYEESPQLPNGYPAMILLSLFPSLWFNYMNRKLENWKNKQKENE